MINLSKYIVWVSTCCLFLASEIVLGNDLYDGPKLGQPTYKVTDENMVNVLTGTITHTVPTVSIGSGSNSLSHDISINANDALNLDSYLHGYKEKFMGGIRTTLYSEIENDNGVSKYYVTSVFDHEGSYDFDLNVSNNTFTSIRKDQVKLTVENSTTLKLTKADGTTVIFKGGISSLVVHNTKSVYAYMTQINRPDGFTIDIHRRPTGLGISAPITSVTTNTGLQLKYIYSRHNRPLASHKLSSTNNPQIQAKSGDWSAQFPTKIIALNNAVEVCSLTSDTCNLTNEWPTATFSWPDGMPRAFYIGDNIFSITDAAGRKTEFHHREHNGYFSSQSSHTGPNIVVPRIKKIVLPTGQVMEYTYQNNPVSTTYWAIAGHSAYVSNSIDGVLKTSKRNGNSIAYNVGAERLKINGNTGELSANSNNFYRGVKEIKFMRVDKGNAKILTGPYYIETWDKVIHLSKDFANQVTEIENKMTDQVSVYTYDSAGRLTETNTNGVIQKAIYGHYNCNAFNCNKPSSVTNAYSPFHGFNTSVSTTTNYSYSTGQLYFVRRPVNSSGVQPAKRFNYQQYTARYKNQSGTVVNAAKSVSLVSSEIYCQNSNLNGTNCAGNDKITVQYHYGSGSSANNLFLLGTTHSSQHESTVYTTCYEYDKYGNMIGESQPESGVSVSSCNAKKGF